MIKYQNLNPDPLTISQFQSQCILAPWCFDSNFQRKEALPIGTCPIITVDSSGKSHILVLSQKKQPVHIERSFPLVQLGEQFRLSIVNANTWFETQLPIWLKNHSITEPYLYCIHSKDLPPKIIDGHSAGLSLLLAQVSILLDIALPKSIICSVAIDKTGLLLPVYELEKKIRAVASYSQIITNFIVCSEQEQEAKNIIESLAFPHKLQILAFNNINEVLRRLVLVNQKTIIENLNLELLQKDISLFIDFLFFRVLKGKSQIFGWMSLSQTLHLISSQHSEGLSNDALQRLKLINVISNRYAQNNSSKSRLSKEDVIWILKFPTATILQVWPHLLQQICSHPDSIEEDAKSKILRQTQLYLPKQKQEIIAAPYLRVLGAYARYLSTDNKKREAFSKQLQAFQGWLNNSIYQEASYPLCELLILAGELNEAKLHLQARNCYNLLHNRPDGILPRNHGYILCAEMIRRQANQEDWTELAKTLLMPFNSFPHQLKVFVEKKANSWIKSVDN